MYLWQHVHIQDKAADKSDMTRLVLITSALLFLLVGSALTQTKMRRDPCNRSVLVQVDSSLDHLSDHLLERFLLTFDSTCHINAEYSEWSNDLLFKVLQAHPRGVLAILQSNRNVDFTYILSILQDPIGDCDIQWIYSEVQKVQGFSDIKRRVLESLEQAAIDLDQALR